MLKPKSSHVFITLFFLITSCKPSDKTILPRSTGKPGTLVIVSDDATHHTLKSDLDAIFLNRETDTLSTEVFFEILKPNPGVFTKLFFNQKTVLLLVTENNYKEMKELISPFPEATISKLINDPNSTFLSASDVFAKPQHIVYLFGKNGADLQNKLAKNKSSLLDTLLSFELTDQGKILYADTGKNGTYYTTLKEKYGVGLRIPSTFKLNQAQDNFYWFQMDTLEEGAQKTLGIIIHAYPYTDSSDFSYINIRSRRDTICKHHIFGELKGTYMTTTESDFYPVRSREIIQLNGYTTCKIKGWWTIKGLSMAGPFVRYAVYIPQKKLIFAFEGYTYTADLNRKERDIRLFEAMALSIK